VGMFSEFVSDFIEAGGETLFLLFFTKRPAKICEAVSTHKKVLILLSGPSK
jgi:hypothetical protein